MPKQKNSPEETQAAVLTTFRTYGWEGASLARLSAATGLGRSSLYHHFPNGKEDMALAAMDDAAAWFSELVLEPLAGEGAPAIRLGRAIAGLDRYYEKGGKACLVELFSVADASDAVRDGAKSLAMALIDAFAALAREAGFAKPEAKTRALHAVTDLEGALVLARALQSGDAFKASMARLPKILLEG